MDDQQATVMHYCPKHQQVMPGRTWPHTAGDDGKRVQVFECSVCKTTTNVNFNAADPGDFDRNYDEPDNTDLDV